MERRRMFDVTSSQPVGNRWYRIDKKLLPLKGLHLLMFAADGCLMPFLPLYMHQLGFTLSEVGLMYSITKFTNFFAQPGVGVIADKFRQHKMILTLSCGSWGLFSILLLLIPARSTLTTRDINTQSVHECDLEQHVGLCKNTSTSLVLCSTERACLLNTTSIYNNTGKFNLHYSVKCEQGVSNTSLKCLITESNPHIEDLIQCLDDASHSNLDADIEFFSIESENRKTSRNTEGSNSLQRSSCVCHRSKGLDYRNTSTHDVLTVFNCSVNESSHRPYRNSSPQNFSFWIFTAIFLVFSVAQSNTKTLSTAVTYNTLETKGNKWGRQRLYGTIGYAVFALSSAFIMDGMRKTRLEMDYDVAFYICGGLCLLTTLTCLSLTVSKDLKCSRLLTDVGLLLTNAEILTFLFTVFCLGNMAAVNEAFVYLFLKSLGGQQIVLGLSVVVGCTVEVLLLFISDKLIERFGQLTCLYAACIAFAIRFIGYSLITNAWYVLPIETLQGVTFGVMFAASSSYINSTAPKELMATAQGLLHGVYYALGRGVGSIISGHLFDKIGARWTFRAYSVFAVVLLLFYASANGLCLKRGKNQPTFTGSPTHGMYYE